MLQKDRNPVAVDRRKSPPHDGNLMMFELSVDGHHVVYIRHLVRYWCEQAWIARETSGHLYIVVAPQFLEKYPETVAIAQNYPQSKVSFVAVTTAEEAALSHGPKSFIQRKIRAWQEWDLVRAYAERLDIAHCFLDSFDFFFGPFVLGKSLSCSVSGIYFKPTFHYATFATHTPTLKFYLQQKREQLAMAAVFRQPNLHRLFCLDPFAVEVLNRRIAKGKAVRLADPVPIYQSDESAETLSALKSQLNISPDRKVFLLFGDLTARKGIEQLLAAIALLPPASCQRLCLLVVGRCRDSAKQQLQANIKRLSETQPVQVMEHYDFVSDAVLQAYFQLSDVVLAPYQKHVGMSGILLQAAAAGKPVLSSDYGLMGELVRLYQLGLAVDSTCPNALADGLARCLEAPLEDVYSLSKMTEFARQNTVDKFAQTIFETLIEQS